MPEDAPTHQLIYFFSIDDVYNAQGQTVSAPSEADKLARQLRQMLSEGKGRKVSTLKRANVAQRPGFTFDVIATKAIPVVPGSPTSWWVEEGFKTRFLFLQGQGDSIIVTLEAAQERFAALASKAKPVLQSLELSE